MARIFYRERNKINEGDRQPRFAVVGVQGTDMTFFQFHMRKSELDAIAQVIGAELVMLPRGSEEHPSSSLRSICERRRLMPTRHCESCAD